MSIKALKVWLLSFIVIPVSVLASGDDYPITINIVNELKNPIKFTKMDNIYCAEKINIPDTINPGTTPTTIKIKDSDVACKGGDSGWTWDIVELGPYNSTVPNLWLPASKPLQIYSQKCSGICTWIERVPGDIHAYNYHVHYLP